MAKKEEIKKTPRGRKPKDASKSICLKALKESLGIISIACQKSNISRQTFYTWYKEDEKFREEVDNISESQKDFVEHSLLKKIKSGDSQCIIFYCRSKMKDRGYVTRYELTGEDGESIKADVKGDINANVNITKFSDVFKKMKGEE